MQTCLYCTAFFTSLQIAIKTFSTVETVFKYFYRRSIKNPPKWRRLFYLKFAMQTCLYCTAFFTSLQIAIKTFSTVETVFKYFYRRSIKKSAEMPSAFLSQSSLRVLSLLYCVFHFVAKRNKNIFDC